MFLLISLLAILLPVVFQLYVKLNPVIDNICILCINASLKVRIRKNLDNKMRIECDWE